MFLCFVTYIIGNFLSHTWSLGLGSLVACLKFTKCRRLAHRQSDDSLKHGKRNNISKPSCDWLRINIGYFVRFEHPVQRNCVGSTLDIRLVGKILFLIIYRYIDATLFMCM